MATTLKHLTNGSSGGAGLPCPVPNASTTAQTIYEVPAATSAQISLITIAFRLSAVVSGANAYLMVCHVPSGGAASEANVIKYIDLLTVSSTTLLYTAELGVGLIMSTGDKLQIKFGASATVGGGAASAYGVEF
jgi:hypothetical protein